MIKKGGYLLYQKKRINFAPEIRTTACRQKGSFFFRIAERDAMPNREKGFFIFLIPFRNLTCV